MKWNNIITLTCVLAFAFTTRLDAGFRIRPVADKPDDSGTREPREPRDPQEPRDPKEPQEPREPRDDHEDPMHRIIRHLMKRFDRDRNGSISVREAPKWLRERFARADSNRDGQLDAKELLELLGKKPGDKGRPEHPPTHHPPRDNTPPPRY